ncbi:hypothetical protein NQ317_013890 [Molorchus minor]|uniref:DNA mismatch repair proteins mutS family domain-containing protein n=1 Tax=Molorchus minor TaxID=1323400 RepID=A0ABQ9K7K5_9CUCU|nr:hypothetical protein NQ317_013890 [Molorchus minor]
MGKIQQSGGTTVLEFRKNAMGESHDTEELEEESTVSEEAVNILCIVHRTSKIGSAYYNFQEKQLYVYEEFIDVGSEFLSTISLLREVRPKFILTFGNTADDFVKVLIDTIITTDTTVTSNSLRSLPENFFLLPLKEYTYEICKAIISQLNLASNAEEPSEVTRNVLLNPTRNIEDLNKRLDFINFVLQPSNKDFISGLQENMRQLGNDINTILTRIQNIKATNRDWNVLYKTIYHAIFINDLCGPYREKSVLIKELQNAISPDLLGLEHSIANGLDFNAGQKWGRPVIRFGLDENLDAKKLRQQGIAKDVTAAARFAANNLPEFLNECAVVYLPEMGHLIAIKEWEPGCDPDQLQDLGFQFMFTLRGTIHYKNPLCIELDKRLGDINSEIIDHENRILGRLSGFTLKYNKDIREPLKIIGLMDCLISMAITASQNVYVRPKLNTKNIFEIEECRHPLMEHLLLQFQSNNFYSGDKYSRMKIITGPNGSGKSMYLRQIALIVFLAHIGSYVPAKNANIGLVHSIHSRMQATESASVRLSAFMIDVSQMTQALNVATSSSLILMDEFGRGTMEKDGITLLIGALKHFINKVEGCPHLLVSTHFQQIVSHLPVTPLVEYQKMDHRKDDGCLYFLYKIGQGVSNSFAFDIAEGVGLDKDILSRAKEILNCLKNNETIPPLPNSRRNYRTEMVMELDIPEPDN